MSGFETVLNALGKYSWRAMFGIFVASGVVLFFSCQLNIYDWTQSYRGLLVLLFISSGAFQLTYIWSELYPFISNTIKASSEIHIGKKHLQQLTEDEKVVCKHFIDNKGQSYRTDPANGEVAALVLKKVLYAPGTAYPGGLYDYQIQRWAFEYLKKHLKVLVKAVE